MAAPNFNLLQNRVTIAGRNEIIRQTLYDFQIYPTAGLTAMSFFQQQKGQGQASYQGAAAGTVKGVWDTNMDMSGTIPAGKIFRVESIEVPFFPGAVATANTWTPALVNGFAAVAAAAVQSAMQDVVDFYSSGALQFFILSKSYLDEAPLGRFPPKTHLDARLAVASNSATTAEILAGVAFAVGRPYMVNPEITLTSVQNFAVNLTWGAAIATPSGFNARVGVILDGVLERAAQ